MNDSEFGAEGVAATSLTLRLFEQGELDIKVTHERTGIPVSSLLSYLRHRKGSRVRGWGLTVAWYSPRALAPALARWLRRREARREGR